MRTSIFLSAIILSEAIRPGMDLPDDISTFLAVALTVFMVVDIIDIFKK